MRERNGSKGKAARQETAQEEDEKKKKKYHCEEVDLAFCSRRNFKSMF